MVAFAKKQRLLVDDWKREGFIFLVRVAKYAFLLPVVARGPNYGRDEAILINL
jgi:hypothetical protein